MFEFSIKFISPVSF